MKKILTIIALFAVFILPLASAQDITITKKVIHPIVIEEFSVPAQVHLEITPNSAISDYYYVDTLLDMNFTPNEVGTIMAGGSRGVDLSISPSADFKSDKYGNYAFEYFVRGDRTPITRDVMVLSFLPMKDFVKIDMPSAITPDDSKMTIGMSFKDNLSMDTAVSIKSKFFEKSVTLPITSASQEVEVDLNTDKKAAGVYEITFEFAINNENAVVTRDLILNPSISVESSEKVSGNILMRQFSSTKTNTGNTPTKVTVEMNQSIWTSLFTSSEGDPQIERDGTMYVYLWDKELNPQESFTAVLRVNYYIPFLIFILIIIAFAVYKAITTSQIQITKSAVRVRTKSGMFASKVIITLKNKGGPVSNLKVIDRLPAFTELLPERFGILEPSEIKKRSLVWDFQKLNRAEEIMFSYIVYSKITIFGKLEVPPAIVTFVDKAGNAKETFSNKVFILAEEAKEEKF